MPDLNRIRFVTGNYSLLQGLGTVALGIFAMFAAAEAAGWLPFWQMMVIVLPLFILSGIAIDRYYRGKYGRVTPPERAKRFMQGALAGIGYAVFMNVDQHFSSPILVLPIYIAALLFTRYWKDRNFYRHYLVGAAAVIVADVARTVAAPDPQSLWSNSEFFSYVILSPVLIVLGLIDHYFLVRTFQSRPEAEVAAHD